MFCVGSTWHLVRTVARLGTPLMFAFVVAMLPLSAYAAQITVDGTTCTLADAVQAANTDTGTGGCAAGHGTDTLLLTTDTYSLANGPFNHNGLTATPSIVSTIIISGGVNGATIERSGVELYRLFHVGETGKLTVQNVAIRNGNINGRGGAIYNLGVLTLLNSQVISNTATEGGGIFNYNGSTATLTNSDFIDNSAEHGGGFYNRDSSTATLTDSDFIANSATYGGGFYNLNGGMATLTRNEFIGNSAERGGGFYNNFSTARLSASSFISNTATEGGGFYNYDGSMATVTDGDFTSNTAERGGGFYNFGTATLTGSHFIGNAASSGGGIYNYDSNDIGSILALTNIEMRANVASGSGGGLYQDNGQAMIVGSRFLENAAGSTGGALQQKDGSISMIQSCIVKNTDKAVGRSGGNVISAANNWWGAPDGPSGVAFGAGDSVDSSVTFAPMLATAPANCPTLAAELAFVKSASVSGTLMPGQPITYVLTLTNTGASAVRGISINDSLPSEFDLAQTRLNPPSITLNGNSYIIAELLPSQVATISFVGQVDATLTANAELSNVATLNNSLTGELKSSVKHNIVVPVVEWSAANYETNEDTDTFTTILNLSLPNPYAAVTVETTIIDSAESNVETAAIQNITFPPGSTSKSVVVTVQDDSIVVPREIHLGLQSPVGAAISEGGNANAVVKLHEDDAAPALLVSTHVSNARAEVGDRVTYSYYITNTGNVTLTTISTNDNKFGTVKALEGELQPQATRSATITYTVKASDLPGPLVNLVVVLGTDTFGTVVFSSASTGVSTQPRGTGEMLGSIFLPLVNRKVGGYRFKV